MRLFVAVDLDDLARRAAARSIDRLRQIVQQTAPRSRITWVEADRLHVTLRFLGEVDPERAGQVERRLAEPWPMQPFAVELGRAGVFPVSGAPRVIWLAVNDGGGLLARLHEELEARLVPLGFEPEGRAFRAHLTLGRVREVPGAAGAAVRSAVAQFAEGSAARWIVGHVTLYESRLSPQGPDYIPRLIQPLGDAS
jgi:2'-5' RNA ligase